ncbi:MAG: hypothetical protein HKM06_01695 [Spirochaetales bacterium]|nr:hypothetical protein [Spirochaetales bacterium]
MKALKMSLILALVVLAVTSCTTFKASGLSYTTAPAQQTSLGTFHTEVWVNGFLGASGGTKLFNISSDFTDQAVKDAIQKEIAAKGGTAAVDVTIENQASFVDIILNAITDDLYAPSNLIISGTIVK